MSKSPVTFAWVDAPPLTEEEILAWEVQEMERRERQRLSMRRIVVHRSVPAAAPKHKRVIKSTKQKAGSWPLDDRLPADVAREQYYWGQMRRVARLREQGLTYAEIGKCMNLSGTRIRQIAERDQRVGKRASPAEKYMAAQPATTKREAQKLLAFFAGCQGAIERKVFRDWLYL